MALGYAFYKLNAANWRFKHVIMSEWSQQYQFAFEEQKNMVQLYADKDIQNHFMQSFFSVSTFIQILPIRFDKKKYFSLF